MSERELLTVKRDAESPEVSDRFYERYHIDTEVAPDHIPMPSRFLVHVKKHKLAGLLMKELFHYRGKKDVILSRPCLYGVFSGPFGGFSPRPQHCVGCLRCTTQYPDWVTVLRNPEREHLGDSYFNLHHVETVDYEAQTGRVPVRGAGYRGKFGGEGWDGMWTDMSEIVRPTRDGIHGREFISTAVDIGRKPSFLQFDGSGDVAGESPEMMTLPIPMILDTLPESVLTKGVVDVLVRTAEETESLCILPTGTVLSHHINSRHVVPLISPSDSHHVGRFSTPPMVELNGWSDELYDVVRRSFPETVVSVRLVFSDDLDRQFTELMEAGVRVFHLAADYHGRGASGEFVLDLIMKAHDILVNMGRRDEVTLIGSGGMIVAEHIPKGIIAGLDVVAVNTPLLMALQGRMMGDCSDRTDSRFELPDIPVDWGTQRLKNLLCSWRDQLLEIMGAMGLREVRRLRGERGRAMFQHDLEEEAFGEIEGYAS